MSAQEQPPIPELSPPNPFSRELNIDFSNPETFDAAYVVLSIIAHAESKRVSEEAKIRAQRLAEMTDEAFLDLMGVQKTELRAVE